jgi:hypothetical protein
VVAPFYLIYEIFPYVVNYDHYFHFSFEKYYNTPTLSFVIIFIFPSKNIITQHLFLLFVILHLFLTNLILSFPIMPPKKKKQVAINNNIIRSGVDSTAAAEVPLSNPKYSKSTRKAPLPESKSRVVAQSNGRKRVAKISRSNGESRKGSLAGALNHPANALPKSAEGAIFWQNDVQPRLLLQLQTAIVVSKGFQEKFEKHSSPVGPPVI